MGARVFVMILQTILCIPRKGAVLLIQFSALVVNRQRELISGILESVDIASRRKEL
jgi:hypothetical protein